MQATGNAKWLNFIPAKMSGMGHNMAKNIVIEPDDLTGEVVRHAQTEGNRVLHS